MFRLLFIAIAISFVCLNLAHAAEVKGVVYGMDENGKKIPLPKATISAIGEKVGTFTDSKGHFKLKVSDKVHNIVASFAGYEKDTVHIHADHHEGHDHEAENHEAEENEHEGHDHEEELLEIVLRPNFSTKAVQVVGEKSAIDISLSSSVKMETITAKGLHKAACCNLAESFEVSPSVDVEYSDAVSGAKRIQLLGLSGTYSQLMIEKVPSLRGLGSIYGLAYVPGPWMESIQVSKGAASVSTGFESMTGQINVEFKKPENLDPTFINVYGDQMGRAELNINHAMKVNDNLSTMLLAHGNYYNTKIDHNDDSFLDKPLVSQVNLQNRWKYHGEVWESVTAAKALIEERKGGQKAYYTDDDPSKYGINVKTQRYEVSTKNGFVFNDEPFSSLGTIISFAHHKQESFYGLRSYNGEQNSFYANLLYQFEAIEDVGVTTGFSYQYDNYLEQFDSYNADRMESIPGLFAEFTVTTIEDLTILAGFRADFPNEYDPFLTPRLHLRYGIDDLTTLRASIGKGYRIPHIFAENTGLLASSRQVIINGTLEPEEALNYGVNASTIVNLFGMDFTFNAEYYHTDFQNQVILDMDSEPGKATFSNLDGKSYSNSVQFDMQFEPITRLVLTAAYRLNDVKVTIADELVDKPLQSRHKGFFNAMYDTKDNGWNFDVTLEYNGGGRLPNTSANPEEYRLDENFEGFLIMNAQITKRFKNWDIYVGGENLADFVQHRPILAYDKPFGENFDSSMIWGPVVGRMIYAGIRVNLD